MRPQITCNCTAYTRTLAGAISRRIGSAPAPKRLRLADAFALLLTPVFATAFVADAKWKDRRRQEWESKIAEVENELERLRCQEGQILCSLRLGPFPTGRRPFQTRSYSSSAQTSLIGDENDAEEQNAKLAVSSQELREDVETPIWSDDADGPYTLEPPEVGAGVEEQDGYTNVPLGGDLLAAARRLERLAAIKLALGMLAHIHVGPRPQWRELDSVFDIPPELTNDLEGIAKSLQQVRRSLARLQTAAGLAPPFRYPRPSQAEIDKGIIELSTNFQSGAFPVPELVKRISLVLLRSEEAPSSRAYGSLIRSLSAAKLKDLTSLTMAAVFDARLALSNSMLFTLFIQFGKLRDVKRLEQFMWYLQNPDFKERLLSRWTWREVGGIRIPYPSPHNPKLLCALIYAALQCSQPHRAEAWAEVLSEEEVPIEDAFYISFHFLQYYTIYRDWNRGKEWLMIALDWCVALPLFKIVDLQRTIHAMLEFCVRCDKQEVYKAILHSAVRARVGISQTLRPFCKYPDTKNDRCVGIRREWQRLHNSVPKCAEDAYPDLEKARVFSSLVHSNLTRLQWEVTEGRYESNMPPRSAKRRLPQLEAFATRWHETHNRQEEEIKKLGDEIAQLKSCVHVSSRRTITDSVVNPESESETSVSTRCQAQCAGNISENGLKRQPDVTPTIATASHSAERPVGTVPANQSDRPVDQNHLALPANAITQSKSKFLDAQPSSASATTITGISDNLYESDLNQSTSPVRRVAWPDNSKDMEIEGLKRSWRKFRDQKEDDIRILRAEVDGLKQSLRSLSEKSSNPIEKGPDVKPAIRWVRSHTSPENSHPLGRAQPNDAETAEAGQSVGLPIIRHSSVRFSEAPPEDVPNSRTRSGSRRDRTRSWWQRR